MEKVEKFAVADAVGMDFVMSDATVDRYGDIVEPSGWDLAAFKKNPIAYLGHDSRAVIGTWENVRVEGGRLIGRLRLAALGTSARIDELIRLVEQGIYRAVSVGFRPLKSEPRKEGGVRYLAQELLECSLVGVGANPSALAMKSLDDTIRRVLGEHADGGLGVVRRSTGEHAAIPTSPMKARKMSTLSDRIQDAQTELVKSRDRLTEMNDADALDLEAIEELNGSIEVQERTLRALERSEAAIAGRPASGNFVTPANQQRKASPGALAIPERRSLHQKEIDPFDLFVRRAVVQVQSVVTGKSYDEILNQRYPGHTDTEIVAKAAVAGATTTAAGWAAELVETATVAFMESLKPISVFPAMAAAGMSVTFGPNAGAIKIPSRAATPSISGSFVGEASPIPVRKLGLTTKTLSPHKMGVISVFSREIAKYSNPTIESVIRQAILDDTAITVDTLLLDATAGSAVRPAGLTNGVAALSATAGADYAAVIGDLKKLINAFSSTNRAIGNLRLLMNPAQDLSLALMPGPSGVGFGWSDQFMTRFGPIVSNSIPVGDVFLVDVSDFVTAVGTPEFDLSEEAVLHLEDTTPLQIGTVGSPATVAAPAQSMFQTAQIAIRMLWDITWNTRRTGAIAWIDNVTW